ncbi:MAG: 16S rRNA (guanine(527)-N(7))-methyltransferase RsmG [Elusimicrobiaceae bacterium]|nr:16S rRNA (guanine(527)-N(7))-methyltransferase RsmG [Elusimicrobiaceae bacterium]
MPRKLLDFARQLSLPLTPLQAEKLVQYAQLVWQKKDMLNLTSAADLEEVLCRHICDGLQGAACVQQLANEQERQTFSLLDAGSGAGYIGITLALALPQAQVTLVESIEKRCAFMNWTILQLGIKNVQVKNVRLGEDKSLQADFVTERAMGQLPDILSVCLGAVKPGGAFIAYQGEKPQLPQAAVEKQGAVLQSSVGYQLPSDLRTRYLVVFNKERV